MVTIRQDIGLDDEQAADVLDASEHTHCAVVSMEVLIPFTPAEGEESADELMDILKTVADERLLGNSINLISSGALQERSRIAALLRTRAALVRLTEELDVFVGTPDPDSKEWN